MEDNSKIPCKDYQPSCNLVNYPVTASRLLQSLKCNKCIPQSGINVKNIPKVVPCI